MWRNASKSENQTFMDPTNPHWGWSWLERWMAARPWETRSTTDKDLNSDRGSIKSTASRAVSVGDISRAYSRRDHNCDKLSPGTKKSNRPSSHQSPSTPTSKAGLRPPSPKGSGCGAHSDSRSVQSVQSDRYYRRHSIAGSSVRDDESLTSSPSLPSYMVPTESAKAKSRVPSPLGFEKNGTSEKGSVGSAKKRLSFPVSPAGPRRHSGPPKVDSSSIKDVKVTS